MITTLPHQRSREPQHVSAAEYAQFARGYYDADIVLHTGKRTIGEITDQDCQEFREAAYAFSQRPDIAFFFGCAKRYGDLLKAYTSSLTCLHVVLFHREQAVAEPRKVMPCWGERKVVPPRMEAVLEKYRKARLLTDMPETAQRVTARVRCFVAWLVEREPRIDSFAAVRREHLLDFAEALKQMIGMRTGKPFTVLTRRGHLSALNVFFRDVASWRWDDVPTRPLLGSGDLPKMPYRVPRYIPEDELARLMIAIRALECPYQRAALLIARWSGARREEIRRLEVDCLDSYPDGTSRLRIPAGKTKKERMIPITELELGHCLRLPQEGPCECDLYLSCAKFVTTPEYAPRLRRRRKQELDLIEDAQQRGWNKEVERHRCTMNRIDQLLKELGEPIEGQEAVY